jgi:16S rRNA (cytosine1402-N4)-methyltransferase
VKARAMAPITSTKRLAEIVAKANPAWEKKKHPATRAFLAIRLFINSELEELQNCLEQALEVLSIGGRLVVISFHSLEDRIVKRFMRKNELGDSMLKGLPLKQMEIKSRLKRIGKAIKPQAAELNLNHRARSAVLRIAEKRL